MSERILQNQAAGPEVFISKQFMDDLISTCVNALPDKAFGLVGGYDACHPRSLYPCSTNLRNTPEWKPVFDSFGQFYSNPDLGFVIAPPEVKAVLDTMESRRESLVGVFHSHRYLRAEPSELDIALSNDPNLLCYIVSTVNPSAPEVGIFRLNGGRYVSVSVAGY